MVVVIGMVVLITEVFVVNSVVRQRLVSVTVTIVGLLETVSKGEAP